MRKLSPQEICFGLVEGKEYQIVDENNNVITQSAFTGYKSNDTTIYAYFYRSQKRVLMCWITGNFSSLIKNRTWYTEE
jgi:hypothetical protein